MVHLVSLQGSLLWQKGEQRHTDTRVREIRTKYTGLRLSCRWPPLPLRKGSPRQQETHTDILYPSRYPLVCPSGESCWSSHPFLSVSWNLGVSLDALLSTRRPNTLLAYRIQFWRVNILLVKAATLTSLKAYPQNKLSMRTDSTGWTPTPSISTPLNAISLLTWRDRLWMWEIFQPSWIIQSLDST